MPPCLTLVVISGCGSTSTSTSNAPMGSTAAPAVTPSTPAATVATTPSTPKSPKQAYSDAYDELPFHQDPLNVKQILLSDGDPGMLDVRVNPRTFFCSNSAAKRLAAVRSYYDTALEKVRREGQNALTIRVSRLVDTGEVRDIYANASSRAVKLTAKGAGASPVAC